MQGLLSLFEKLLAKKRKRLYNDWRIILIERVFDMSLNTQDKIRCPKCGTLNDITLWQSVTVSDSPDLKEELLQGRLNMLVCTECGAKALVPTPLLYRDEEKKLLFSFLPCTDEEEARKQFESVRESSRASGELEGLSGYNLRFIYDYNALLEKILIFDAGLSDKTVEVIKLMVLAQDPDNSDNRTALFGKRYPDGSIEIVVRDLKTNEIFTSKAPGETYKTIHTALKSSGVKEISFDWELVDIAYAEKLLGC